MAIKTEDNEKPVISGMHSTFPETPFNPKDLGEILDVLCTHPYPLFTSYCMTDPLTEEKSTLHAVAETLMYRGLSKKPAFAEEVGTLGSMIASLDNAAAYGNTIMHLLWAHDCLGFMWWCAFEQDHLTHAPYDWDNIERELGLFDSSLEPKPILKTMKKFADFLEDFKYKKLPARTVDAVCIVNAQSDTWLSTYGTFILAKQAGLDIEFCHCEDNIPKANAYFLPSVSHAHLTVRFMREIMKRVEEGAALYVSIGNDAIISHFEPFFGPEPLTHYYPVKDDKVEAFGESFSFRPKFKIDYRATSAEVLATDENGKPVMTKNTYGKGVVYFLAYPIEELAGKEPGVISGSAAAKAYYKFYNELKEFRSSEKTVIKDNPYVTYTEHVADDNTIVVVAVNCVPRESCVNFDLGDRYSFASQIGGETVDVISSKKGHSIQMTMSPNSAVIFEIKK